MSSIDLVILGMVAEGPKSAYDIQRDVAYHHLDRWTRVSAPSIYKKVLRLREDGYLYSRRMPGERLADKAVYGLTDKGRRRFDELMQACAEEAVPLQFNFNVLIANLNKVDKARAAALLSQLRERKHMALQELCAVFTSRSELVATFLSILELCSVGDVHLSREGEDILLSFTGGSVEGALEKIEEM